MQKIAVFGCRDGEYLIEQIKKNGSNIYEVICLCDNDIKYDRVIISDVPVYSIENMLRLYMRGEIQEIIIAVRKGYSRYCIIEQLIELGVKKKDIILMRPSSLTYRLPIVFDRNDIKYDLQWLHMAENNKPIIHHLEAHAADGCNLNCRGCLHFSNLYDRKQFPDTERMIKDLHEIESNCEIFQFRILGGEPLLNADLPEILKRVREALPNTDIAVITNGILIPCIEPELYKIMAKYSIGFNITLYPPTLSLKDKIEAILDEYHVSYGSHIAKTDEFERFMTLNKHEDNNHEAYKVCVPRGICVLKNGRLYKCPIVAYGKIYEETYGLAYDTTWEGVDIYKSDMDWNDVVSKLTAHPIDLCTYCDDKSEFYSWSVGKPDKDDWLVKE